MTKATALFGTSLRISRLDSVDQIKCKMRLIFNSSEESYNATPSVKSSTDKGTPPKAMQFGACLARLLQKVWDSDLADGPIWISK